MPLPIELVKAQLKVWEYKWVGNPGPHWPYANKTTDTLNKPILIGSLLELKIPPGAQGAA